MPSFTRILTAVSDAYRAKPADIARTAESVREMYRVTIEPTRSAGPLSAELLDNAYRTLSQRYVYTPEMVVDGRVNQPGITGGQIAIGDRVVNDLEPKDRDIAMVFQNLSLIQI